MDVLTGRRQSGMPAFHEAAMAQLGKADVQDANRAKDQHRRLQHRRVHDYAHAAEYRVQTRREGQPQGDDPEDVNPVAEDVHMIDVQERADDDVARVNRGGDLRQHQTDHGQEAQYIAGTAAKPEFQEFRHGEYLHAVVQRHERPAQDQNPVGVHFPVGHRHAGGKTGASETDQMFRADVGGEDRGTNL